MEIVYQKDRGVKLTPVIKGKSEKVKTREVKKLMQQFPAIEERVIRVVYANSQFDMSATANALLDMAPAPEPVSYSFLFEMFPELDKEYIGEVYESCGADLNQTTAFILQTTGPQEVEVVMTPHDEEFGNESIGFVNRDALTKRLNADYLIQLVSIFPQVDSDEIARVLAANQGELLPAIQELELLHQSDSPRLEAQRKVVPVPASW
jgi:hypothetical protein